MRNTAYALISCYLQNNAIMSITILEMIAQKEMLKVLQLLPGRSRIQPMNIGSDLPPCFALKMS